MVILRALLISMSCLLLFSISVGAVGNKILEANDLIESKQVGNVEQAINILADIVAETEADNPYYGELLWRMAKGYLYLADRSPDDQQLELYEKGKEYAEQSVLVTPNSPDAHFWLGALIGRVGQAKGILNSLFMVRPLKESLDRVLELDPDYADAYFALSQLYLQAPGWPLSIGDRKEALVTAEQAVGLDPDDPEYKVQLARVLIEYKRIGEAKDLLSEALASPEMEIDDLLKMQAEELVEKF